MGPTNAGKSTLVNRL
ncbi:hypothetical protein ACC723_38905, partial [Rhizobium ruizarguesonis]